MPGATWDGPSVIRPNTGVSCSSVGRPANPVPVLSGRPARSEVLPHAGKASDPAMRMVGEPANETRAASSLVGRSR